MSIAGWSAGKLSAPKLYHSVSASGPTATVKPSSWKISKISSMTRVDGMLARPTHRRRPGMREVEPRGGPAVAPRPRAQRFARLERRLEGLAQLVGGRAERRACRRAASAGERLQRAPSARRSSGRGRAICSASSASAVERGHRGEARAQGVEQRLGMGSSAITDPAVTGMKTAVGPAAHGDRPRRATAPANAGATWRPSPPRRSRAKASASRTARSASTFRLTSTPGLLEPVHQPAVADVVLPGRRVDARDPEPRGNRPSSCGDRGRRTPCRARRFPWRPSRACCGAESRPWRPS